MAIANGQQIKTSDGPQDQGKAKDDEADDQANDLQNPAVNRLAVDNVEADQPQSRMPNPGGQEQEISHAGAASLPDELQNAI